MRFDEGRRIVVIEGVEPEIDAGRFPTKRTTGEKVSVEADIFADGKRGVAGWTELRVQCPVNDFWRGEFYLTELGRYQHTTRSAMRKTALEHCPFVLGRGQAKACPTGLASAAATELTTNYH